jgi:uncharacterized protein (TIGR03382 family)
VPCGVDSPTGSRCDSGSARYSESYLAGPACVPDPLGAGGASASGGFTGSGTGGVEAGGSTPGGEAVNPGGPKTNGVAGSEAGCACSTVGSRKGSPGSLLPLAGLLSLLAFGRRKNPRRA